jgi:hypothetical protein
MYILSIFLQELQALFFNLKCSALYCVNYTGRPAPALFVHSALYQQKFDKQMFTYRFPDFQEIVKIKSVFSVSYYYFFNNT